MGGKKCHFPYIKYFSLHHTGGNVWSISLPATLAYEISLFVTFPPNPFQTNMK